MKQYKKLPFVSGALVIINAVVFLLCLLPGSTLLDKGDLNIFSVLADKEYFRIVSAMFLHANTQHLFNNMLILFFLGAMIEENIGHIWYAVCFFLAGVGGNIASLLVKVKNYDMAGTIGASGAVFGLDGVLLSLVLFSPRRMENVTVPRVIFMIALSLYSGYTGENIDNAAHVGGLITGFCCGCIYCLVTKINQSRHNQFC